MRSLYLAVLGIQRCRSSQTVQRSVAKINPKIPKSPENTQITAQALNFEPDSQNPVAAGVILNETGFDDVFIPIETAAGQSVPIDQALPVGYGLGDLYELNLELPEWKQDLIRDSLVD